MTWCSAGPTAAAEQRSLAARLRHRHLGVEEDRRQRHGQPAGALRHRTRPYNAGYAIPKPTPEPAGPAVTRPARSRSTVTNLGAEAWTPANYYLAYRVYNATDRRGDRPSTAAANLPPPVARGAKVTLDATDQGGCRPGSYFLDFTMVRTGGVVFTDHQVPPGRIVLQVFDVPPVVQELFPDNGYQAPTLTPLLWARAVDTRRAPRRRSPVLRFEICDQDSAGEATDGCNSSATGQDQSWLVPGRPAWSGARITCGAAIVKDAAATRSSPTYSTMISRRAAAGHHLADRRGALRRRRTSEFDAQVGNFSTAAMDVSVVTVEPEPDSWSAPTTASTRAGTASSAPAGPAGTTCGWFRTTTAPATWSSRYPDGAGGAVRQEPGRHVRRRRPAQGREAHRRQREARSCVDRSRQTTYQFSLLYKLQKITDNSAARSVNLTLDGDDRQARAGRR